MLICGNFSRGIIAMTLHPSAKYRVVMASRWDDDQTIIDPCGEATRTGIKAGYTKMQLGDV